MKARTHHASIKRPIRIPVSPSGAVEYYRCREITKDYSESRLFHGGNTGAILALTRRRFDYPKSPLTCGGNMGQEYARISRNRIMQIHSLQPQPVIN